MDNKSALITTPDWHKVLERTRAGCLQSSKYNLCLYWRAQSYLQHQDETEPLARAWAFNNVLDHLWVEADEGLVWGNCAGFAGDTLPAGINEAEFHKQIEAYNLQGQRDFWAGFDHSLADYPTLLSIGIGGYGR